MPVPRHPRPWLIVPLRGPANRFFASSSRGGSVLRGPDDRPWQATPFDQLVPRNVEHRPSPPPVLRSMPSSSATTWTIRGWSRSWNIVRGADHRPPRPHSRVGGSLRCRRRAFRRSAGTTTPTWRASFPSDDALYDSAGPGRRRRRRSECCHGREPRAVVHVGKAVVPMVRQPVVAAKESLIDGAGPNRWKAPRDGARRPDESGASAAPRRRPARAPWLRPPPRPRGLVTEHGGDAMFGLTPLGAFQPRSA